MRYIGIDLGSTSTKGAVLNLETRELEFDCIQPTPPRRGHQPETRYEIDAGSYLVSVQRLIDRLIDVAPDAKGILLSTQMHGYILERATEAPVYVSWQDCASLEPLPSGETALGTLQRLLTDAEMRYAGVPVKANLSMCNLYARTAQGMPLQRGMRFHTLGSYMLTHLGGDYVCHITNAAPTGLVDLLRGDWNWLLVEKLGFGSLDFPKIISGIPACGCYVRNGQSYKLYPDFGDHQVCVLGSGARLDSDWSINIGTAGLLGRIEGKFRQCDGETRPYFDGQYLLSISGLPGGRHLKLAVDFLKDIQMNLTGSVDEDKIWNLLSKCPPVDSWVFDFSECFSGGGSIKNLGTDWNTVKLLGGIIASSARAYADGAGKIGGYAERIVFAGGCAGKNPALRSAICNVLGIQSHLVSTTNDALEGLMMLALVIGGMASNILKAQELCHA